MSDQIATTTLREFLLQEFPSLLSLSNEGATDWRATGQREGTEDMILNIDSSRLTNDELIAAFRRFSESKGYEFEPWAGSTIFFLKMNGDAKLSLFYTYSFDNRIIMISTMPV